MAYNLKPFLERYVPRDGWCLMYHDNSIRRTDCASDCLTTYGNRINGSRGQESLIEGTGVTLENIWAAVDNDKTGNLHPEHAAIRAEILAHCGLKELGC